MDSIYMCNCHRVMMTHDNDESVICTIDYSSSSSTLRLVDTFLKKCLIVLTTVQYQW